MLVFLSPLSSVSVFIILNSFTIQFIIQKFSFKLKPICESINTNSIHLVIDPISFILVTIIPNLSSLSISLVIHKLAFIYASIFTHSNSKSVFLTCLILPMIIIQVNLPFKNTIGISSFISITILMQN